MLKESYMFKRFCFILLISVIFISGTLVSAWADEGKPVAFIENVSYEFGTVYEGTDVLHDFILQNKGNVDLEVTDVKAG